MTDPSYEAENNLCYQNAVLQWLVCVNSDSNVLNGVSFLHLFIHYLLGFSVNE